MHQGRELLVGAIAGLLAIGAVGALWAPGGWSPAWVPGALDIAAALYLALLTFAAVRARLDFVRGSENATSLPAAIIIGLVFALILTGFSASALYALSAKHGLYQPFDAVPNRIGLLAFFADQAVKGAVFDVFEVFGLSVPGAPAFDARAHWGFALLVVVFRFTAAFAVWSLVFSFAAHRAAQQRGTA